MVYPNGSLNRSSKEPRGFESHRLRICYTILMLGIRRIKLHDKPLTPVVINDLLNTKEKIPTPPKKVRILPWIILGLVISLILAGIGTLVWKIIQSSNRPDLTIKAPDKTLLSATPIPTPTGETTTLVPQ